MGFRGLAIRVYHKSQHVTGIVFCACSDMEELVRRKGQMLIALLVRTCMFYYRYFTL